MKLLECTVLYTPVRYSFACMWSTVKNTTARKELMRSTRKMRMRKMRKRMRMRVGIMIGIIRIIMRMRIWI